MRRTNHRTKATAEKYGKKELNKRNSRISGFYTRKNGVTVKRVGPANVVFGSGDKKVYAQLGTGRATMIMDARVKLRKKGRSY